MDYFYDSIKHMFFLALGIYAFVYGLRFLFIHRLTCCKTVDEVMRLYTRRRHYFKKGSSLFSNVGRILYCIFCFVFPWIFAIPCAQHCDTHVWNFIWFLILVFEIFVDFLFYKLELHVYCEMLLFTTMGAFDKVLKEDTLSSDDKILFIEKLFPPPWKKDDGPAKTR